VPLVGLEAIEPRRGAGVLGLVHETGHRVDGDRLVGQAAHVAQRFGFGLPVHGNVEDVAMWTAGGRGEGRGLLAGQPRTPRRGPTGAVADGAAEAAERADVLTLLLVELHGRGAAGSLCVVHGLGERHTIPLLVVADQADRMTAPVE